MGHHLAGLSLNLEALAQRQGPSPPLETARSLTRRLLDDVESLVDTLGRERGARPRAARWPRSAARHPAPARPRGARTDSRSRTRERAHALLRCCQEIVTNAVKHSEAENLWIAIRVQRRAVELTARDDGDGCRAPRPRPGARGHAAAAARSWAAPSTSRPGPGAGFQVRVTLPGGPA